MGELVSSLLTFIDYQVVLTAVAVYVVAMWLMFCLWVFLDARKRYHSVGIALMFGFLVFVFTFPALIFYLVVRPEDSLSEGEQGYFSEPGGVNVPIVNFIGDSGEVEMAINLQVYKQPHPSADMKVKVDWDSQKPHLRVTEPSSGVTSTPSNQPDSSLGATDSRLGSFRERARGSLQKLVDVSKKQVSEYSQDLNSVSDSIVEVQQENAGAERQEKKNKKQSKRRRK